MKWWDSLKTRLLPKGIVVERLSEVHRLIHLAYGHLLMEEYDEARSVLLQASQFRNAVTEPQTIDFILTSLESTWIFTEQFHEGIAFFSDYINGYPKDFAAYRARAALLWYSGQLQEAVEDYSSSLELKSADIVSLSGRGQVLAELGSYKNSVENLDQALETLEAAPKTDPTWVRWYQHMEAFARNGRGFAFGGLGEFQRAMGEFELSMKLSPDNAWVYHNRAQVNDLAGNPEQAKADYQMALKKRRPPLNPLRREQVRSRLTQLGLNPD